MPRRCPSSVPAAPSCIVDLSICHSLAVLSMEPVMQSLSLLLTSTHVTSFECATNVELACSLIILQQLLHVFISTEDQNALLVYLLLLYQWPQIPQLDSCVLTNGDHEGMSAQFAESDASYAVCVAGGDSGASGMRNRLSFLRDEAP